MLDQSYFWFLDVKGTNPDLKDDTENPDNVTDDIKEDRHTAQDGVSEILDWFSVKIIFGSWPQDVSLQLHNAALKNFKKFQMVPPRVFFSKIKNM